jgi:hypothetical protein
LTHHDPGSGEATTFPHIVFSALLRGFLECFSMVKTNISSESEDIQISKLNEFFLVADRIRKAGRYTRQGFRKFKSKTNPNGGGARLPVPSSRESIPFTNRSFPSVAPIVLRFRDSLSEPSDFLPRNPFSKGERKAIRAPEAQAVPSSSARCPVQAWGAQATSERSDGGAREGHRQQSPPKILLSDIPTQVSSGANEASSKSSPPQVLSSQSLPLLHISESVFAFVWEKLDQGNRGAIAARQVAREDTLATRVKDPSEKKDRSTSGKKPSIHTTVPPSNLTLIVHPGSGPGRTSPAGEETQGPSPVDYNLELEVEFPKEMVIEMQGNAAKKARRIVIGRMLRGRATFKELHECLKLHLPATYVLATLLTRGFFLVLFENEEGATQTRKLATVEWNRRSLSFSRYNPNFDANAQGAEALLTHIIKVQFPDLHEQFRNEKTLTIMASKLREVLDIEAADSYMKRPAGPMVTIEVKHIAKLAGYIRIPSMAKGTLATDTIHQSILYSSLPNQCQKCHRFGHQARTCNIARSKAQAGAAQHNSHSNATDGGQPSMREVPTNAARERVQGPTPTAKHDPRALDRCQGHTETKIPWNQTLAPPPPTDLSRIHS